MRCKAFCVLLLLALLTLQVSASEGELLDVLTDGDAQNWVTETLPTLAGEGGEWYAIALSQNGNSYDFSHYAAAATAYFDEHEIKNAVERQRIALALLAVGAESDIPDAVASSTVGKQGVMSWVFGLHLIHNGANSTAYTADEIVQALCERQNEDGGWSVSGTRSDSDVTAMTLQALASHKDLCADTIERALECLSEMQREDGGYVSYGVSNAESCCQVIIALTALGIDPAADERFAKNGNTVLDALQRFCLGDGTYAHTEDGKRNEHACKQALLAMTALERFANGKNGLYTFDRDASVPPQTDETEDTAAESSAQPQESVSPSQDISMPDAPHGMGTMRTAVLIIAATVGTLSLAYLLFAKKH